MSSERIAWLRSVAAAEATATVELLLPVVDAIAQAQSSTEEVVALLDALQARAFDPVCIAAFLGALERARPAHMLTTLPVVNIVGSGGGPSTINISTAAALVAAAAGARVLKSGSRSYRSTCGSQNVISALGIALPRSPQLLCEMLDQCGIAFVSESHYGSLFVRMASYLPHQAVRQWMLPINQLGPWLSPYRVDALMVGVSSFSLFQAYAALDGRISLPRTLLVHSHAGLDELTSFAANECYRFGTDRGVYVMQPPAAALSVTASALAQLAGGKPRENAMRLEAICSGREHGHGRETVVLNAAQLLELAGVSADLRSAQLLAEDTIDRGAAQALLARLRSWSARAFTRSAAGQLAESAEVQFP